MLYFVLAPAMFAKYSSLDEACNDVQRGKKSRFRQLPQNTEVDFDTVGKFASGETIGRGGFGLVKKVSYTPTSATIIIKQVRPADNFERKMVLSEINGLVEFANAKFVPKLYGCTIVGPKEILIVQEMLAYGLDSKIFRNNFQLYSITKSLNMYLELFTGLKIMWDRGFAHNDIKPENMMTNENESKFYLIDLGLVEPNTNSILQGGTPVFMSPSRFSGYTKVKPKDDMYSMAISAVIMEAKEGYDQIFGRSVRVGGSLHYSCCQTHLKMNCRDVIAARAKAVLEKEYGNYQTDQTKEDMINFTTLIVNMIYYDKFNFDHQTVIRIIQRLIDESKGLVQKKVMDVVKENIADMVYGKPKVLRNEAPVVNKYDKLEPEEAPGYLNKRKDYNNNLKQLEDLKDKNKVVKASIRLNVFGQKNIDNDSDSDGVQKKKK